jgi:hypothetical protein
VRLALGGGCGPARKSRFAEIALVGRLGAYGCYAAVTRTGHVSHIWSPSLNSAAPRPRARCVRDRTGQGRGGTRWVHARSAARGAERAPAVTAGHEEVQVNTRCGPRAGNPAGGGPEFESPYLLGSVPCPTACLFSMVTSFTASRQSRRGARSACGPDQEAPRRVLRLPWAA